MRKTTIELTEASQNISIVSTIRDLVEKDRQEWAGRSRTARW
ncbi:MAG: hypothetical protein ACUVSJ_09460 [Anaerolineae bacterium]